LLDEEESDDLNEDQKSFQPLAPTMLIERRYIFHNRLINIVKGHHTVVKFTPEKIFTSITIVIRFIGIFVWLQPTIASA
jgi:hypothetical protein